MGIRYRRKRQSLGCLLFEIIGIIVLIGLIWLFARAFEFFVTGG